MHRCFHLPKQIGINTNLFRRLGSQKYLIGKMLKAHHWKIKLEIGKVQSIMVIFHHKRREKDRMTEPVDKNLDKE